MDAMNEIATALRLLREAKGISQPKLAQRSGISRAMVSRYETAAVEPRIITVDKVLRGLEADWSDFHHALQWIRCLRQPASEEAPSYVLVPVSALEARLAAGRPQAVAKAVVNAVRFPAPEEGSSPAEADNGTEEG